MNESQLTELLSMARAAAESSAAAVEHYQDLRDRLNELTSDVRLLRAEVTGMAKELDTMSKVVRGNGTTENSLVSRMQSVEFQLASQREFCKKRMETVAIEKQQNKSTFISLLVALIGGIAGIITTILHVIF